MWSTLRQNRLKRKNFLTFVSTPYLVLVEGMRRFGCGWGTRGNESGIWVQWRGGDGRWRKVVEMGRWLGGGFAGCLIVGWREQSWWQIWSTKTWCKKIGLMFTLYFLLQFISIQFFFPSLCCSIKWYIIITYLSLLIPMYL